MANIESTHNLQIIAEKSINFEYAEFQADLTSLQLKIIYNETKVWSIHATLSGEIQIICVLSSNGLSYKKLFLKILYTAALMVC